MLSFCFSRLRAWLRGALEIQPQTFELLCDAREHGQAKQPSTPLLNTSKGRLVSCTREGSLAEHCAQAERLAEGLIPVFRL